MWCVRQQSASRPGHKARSRYPDDERLRCPIPSGDSTIPVRNSANLLARLPEEHQATAYDQRWRKDWQDKEPHLLPAKHLSAWIQANLYLSLADAPFDREDTTLNPTAGACVTCPRRSGFNPSLFADVQGDQCLDAPCFHLKIAAHLDRELAARPGLVQIETAWRNPKEQRPGALQKNQTQEVPELNPDAEPPCANTKAAIIVFGKQVGRTLTVCTDLKCPVHNPQVAAQVSSEPPPAMPEAKPEETEEEAAQRQAEHQEQMREYKAEQKRKKEERKAEFERQQQEHEAEQARREKQRQTRVATFERIIEHAPPSFNPAQMRVFLRLFILMEPYSFLEEVASHFAGDENRQQTDEEIVLEALAETADEKLTGLALRLVLSDHVGIPHETQVDLLTEA